MEFMTGANSPEVCNLSREIVRLFADLTDRNSWLPGVML